MTEFLRGDAVTLYRGDHCLFTGLDFALKAGEALLVQGPNGSGKTSLLRAAAGLLDLEDGEIRWRGNPATANRQAFHADVAWFAHRPGCKNDLTVRENLQLESGLRAMRIAELEPVLERLTLSRVRDLPFRALSAGQQRRVALARLLLSTASIWLMDEPFTNLDTAGHELVIDVMREHLAKGGGCLFASHLDVELHDGMPRIQLA